MATGRREPILKDGMSLYVPFLTRRASVSRISERASGSLPSGSVSLRRAKSDVIAARHDWVILTKPFDFFWPRLMPANHPTRFAFMSGGTDFMRGDRWLSGHIAAMVACSHFNAQQNYARFKRRVGVMFNGVDTSRFLPGQRDVQRRLALGFQPGDVVFVFAGRLIGLKGLHLAVQALAEPSLSDLPAKLLIVGNGDALPRLQRLAADLGVDERIVFHPAVPHAELPALYACADVGLFPGLGEEAFGISVAEAMACGLPVVASYNGGMPEVIGNEGSCGHLFALGDVEACAGAMATMCLSPELGPPPWAPPHARESRPSLPGGRQPSACWPR